MAIRLDPALILSPGLGTDLFEHIQELERHGSAGARWLSVAQRALLATGFVSSRHGGARRGDADTGQTLEDVASATGVSPRSIRYARQIRDAGSVAVTHAVARGDLRTSDALFILKHCASGKDRAYAVRQCVHHGKRGIDCLPKHIAGPLSKRWAKKQAEYDKETQRRREEFIRWRAETGN
jgi:hypothetical protein